jgi:hypothetical protein
MPSASSLSARRPAVPLVLADPMGRFGFKDKRLTLEQNVPKDGSGERFDNLAKPSGRS